MMRLAFAGCLLMLGHAAAAQAPLSSGETRIDIALRSFKYEPATITLEHGKPYQLHFVNRASGGHDFVAKRFFAAAHPTRSGQSLPANGEVELEGGEAADVHLIAPAAGRYDVHCSHFMHSAFGMKGEIVVR